MGFREEMEKFRDDDEDVVTEEPVEDDDAIVVELEDDEDGKDTEADEAEDTKEEVEAADAIEAVEGKKEKEKIGNPYAALRLMKRENEILSKRFNKLLEVVSEKKEDTKEVEPPLPDYSEDPVGHVNAKQDKVLKKLDKLEANAEKEREASEFMEVFRGADEQIREFKESIGVEDYAAAVQHLCSVREADMIDENPEMTIAEIHDLLFRKAVEEKYNIAKSGRNPGEVLYKKAVRSGYKPVKKEAKDGPKLKDKEDATKEVARQKAKDKGSVTISGVKSKPPKSSLKSRDIVGLSEDEFDAMVDEVSKSKGRNKAMIRDLL